MAVQVEVKPSEGTAAVGVDLGLKDCATASTGEKLQGRWYRQHEQALATAQRARKKKRARPIHAKIKNQRKNDMHQFSSQLVRENAAIFVGDVASAKLLTSSHAMNGRDSLYRRVSSERAKLGTAQARVETANLSRWLFLFT